MQEWMRQIFEAGDFSLLMLPAAFLLGLVTAVGSGCNVATLAAIGGYAASRKEKGSRDAVFLCAGFAMATVGALVVGGAVVGSIGGIGRYGRLAAGFVMIVFGLGALNLLPFRIPRPKFLDKKVQAGQAGGFVLGMTLGAATASCSLLCCSPLLIMMLGASAVQASAAAGALNMALFAVGFCVPIAVIMMGIGMGKVTSWGSKVAGPLRIGGALLLIGVGFYFLATL